MRGDARNPAWEEIEPAIAAVWELPEEHRAAYLAQLPPPIRAEVNFLMAAYRRAGSFSADEAGKPIATAELLARMKTLLAAASPEIEGAAESNRPPIAVNPGTQLGHYRIEGVIGRGGMGVVHRALDTRLNRPVAVKFLFDDLADPAARRRFQREAQMASSLNHPHILTVYDAGDFEGRQYLVTEFIDGGTLKAWASADKRTWREIVALLLGVADGLAAAHRAGILHRDIKPDNILVGANGYAKLSDFGLAKLQEPVTPEEVTRTLNSQHAVPGAIMGTIAYMSPEQASGRPTDP
ncbi:MAG TPA: serine/threonine-protein kinase, partial [Bryobacteraceae bacterium]|nr:serine/threonine-protein kinase [Bryobacteraceae bacterium]